MCWWEVAGAHGVVKARASWPVNLQIRRTGNRINDRRNLRFNFTGEDIDGVCRRDIGVPRLAGYWLVDRALAFSNLDYSTVERRFGNFRLPGDFRLPSSDFSLLSPHSSQIPGKRRCCCCELAIVSIFKVQLVVQVFLMLLLHLSYNCNLAVCKCLVVQVFCRWFGCSGVLQMLVTCCAGVLNASHLF
uniref:Uncharacterized protein n=1 Tax=Nicotiana tabacum TaxID=4097 RepID=A0A1S3XXZ0_TOBAC|nr:PREDICTED: uncharacterized protein LOC107770050 [Nicotiana tabacum]